jgi:SPP1 gp7 family putative phage head morphogenesis protein
MPKRAKAMAKAWGASKRAESRYVLDLVQIMRGTHDGIMKVVEHEHLSPPIHSDAKKPPAGLGTKLLQRVVKWQKPRVEDAFDRMSAGVDSKTQAAAVLHGIHVKHVAGVDAAIDHARRMNVALIANATSDFLQQVRETLEEREGEPPESIRKALQERTDVSKSRAMLIARDQTLRLNSQIAEHRQRSAGITQYRWSTVGDERVRPRHEELDGEIISWDDPPEVDDDGTLAHAGRDFQCRCTPSPIVDEFEEADEPGEEDDLAAE